MKLTIYFDNDICKEYDGTQQGQKKPIDLMFKMLLYQTHNKG